MKRILVFLLLVLVAGAAYAITDWDQKVFLASGGSQTFSWFTTYGYHASGATILVSGGTDATLTFRAVGTGTYDEDKIVTIRNGSGIVIEHSIDSLTVTFTAGSGSCDVVAWGER